MRYYLGLEEVSTGVRKLETNVDQVEVYIRLGWKFVKPFITEAEGMDWVNEGGHHPAYKQAPYSENLVS